MLQKQIPTIVGELQLDKVIVGAATMAAASALVTGTIPLPKFIPSHITPRSTNTKILQNKIESRQVLSHELGHSKAIENRKNRFKFTSPDSLESIVNSKNSL